jgi:hypothetical protein
MLRQIALRGFQARRERVFQVDAEHFLAELKSPRGVLDYLHGLDPGEFVGNQPHLGNISIAWRCSSISFNA